MDKHLTSFLIAFSLMFVLHYLLEPTYAVNEPRQWSLRTIANYTLGTLGICISFLYQHPDMLIDLAVSVLGAGSAVALAHSRDFLTILLKRDRANGLIDASKKEA